MAEVVRGVAEYLVVADGGLTAEFDVVEESLLAPLARGAALEVVADAAAALAALHRIRAALTAAVAEGPRVLAPNGRWEHAGLRLVRLDSADLDLLRAARLDLTRALLTPSRADLLRGLSGGEAAPTALVGALARALSATDLAPDEDTAALTDALRGVAAGDDIRLTAQQEESWQRLAHRVTMLLTESPPLHRFLG
jgi:hypothetical protein